MNTAGGYSPKELHFDKSARDKLVSGIKKIAKCVKSTLGPMGQTVLIESQEHLKGITVTKDGVTVAKSISLIDPVENLAVRMMPELCRYRVDLREGRQRWDRDHRKE